MYYLMCGGGVTGGVLLIFWGSKITEFVTIFLLLVKGSVRARIGVAVTGNVFFFIKALLSSKDSFPGACLKVLSFSSDILLYF
jgi:hypothetical protein